ncbi:hypothetical protein ACFL6T_01475 [Candidatus Zixiibacteriota bacterium]
MAIHRIRPRHIALLSTITIVMLAGAGFSNDPSSPQDTTSFSSRSANIPDLTWNPINGDEVRLRSLEGFGVLYSFIDPRDDRQSAQLPILKELAEKYASKGLKVIMVVAAALPDTLAPGSFFTGYDWPVVVWNDQAGLSGAGVTSIPMTSIVDRKCQVVMKVGLITDRNQMMLEGAIAAALR